MRSMLSRALAASIVLLAAAACTRGPGSGLSPVDFRRSVAGGEWQLVELGGRTPPEGAGGRRATLVFEADTARAGGFSGCNSYGGTYTLDGASLRFGAMAMTRMACDRGMDLEQQYAGVLDRVTGYELAGSELRLLEGSTVVARFNRAGP